MRIEGFYGFLEGIYGLLQIIPLDMLGVDHVSQIPIAQKMRIEGFFWCICDHGGYLTITHIWNRDNMNQKTRVEVCIVSVLNHVLFPMGQARITPKDES